MAAITSLVVAVVSVLYSYMQSRDQQKRFKKMQEEAERRADQAKGFQIVTEAEAAPLYVPYGRNKAGGIRVYHRVASAVPFYDAAAGGQTFRSAGSGAGEKNQWLVIQQVICFAGIHRVVAIDVDDRAYTDPELESSVAVNVYPKGNVIDPMIAAFDPSRNTAKFTNMAYATAAFRMNRDQPQYSGVPSVNFYIEGMEINEITSTGGVLGVGNKAYSNNPSRCLLDYLTNSVYGKGLDIAYIDLPSFYAAQQLCEKVMLIDMAKNGKVWQAVSEQRDVKRFETNIALSSENSLRDNIEKLLEGMDMAELIWSGGKYKLSLKYPLTYNSGNTYGLDDVVQTLNEGTIDLYRSLVASNNNALGSQYWARDAASYITDDDLIRHTEISISWPSARERYNRVTVRFRNEAKNFADDTVTWPLSDSGVYATYLQEDGGQPLETDSFEEAITDQWHALARAEQRCRYSRLAAQYKFTLGPSWSELEPGDLLFISSDVLKTYNALVRVTETQLNADGTVSVDGSRYDASLLAWNAVDSEYIATSVTDNFSIAHASNLRYNADNRAMTGSVGFLSWDAAIDSRVSKYYVYATATLPEFITADTEWQELGVTSNLFFSIPAIPAGYYTLAVAASTSSGRLARQFGILSNDRWPMLSVGLGSVMSGSEAMYSATLYRRSASISLPPSGGAFDFESLVFTEVPANWSLTIPSGANQLYRSSAVLKSTDAVFVWSEPQAIADVNTRVTIDNPVVVVLQDEFKANLGYENAKGQFTAILNNANVTLSGSTDFTIVSSTNCAVTLANSGAEKGSFAVTSLLGNSGSFQVRVAFGGNEFFRTVSVYGLYTGYQKDLTAPPAPSGATVTVGLNTVFIDLDTLPNYSEGNGHLRTEVWGVYGTTGLFANAELITHFDGVSTAFPSTLGTPLRIWLAYRSMDDVLSSPIGGLNGFDATTGKIQTGDIATQAITNALIGNAAIDTAKIADGAITNAKIGNLIQSTTYQQGIAGWKIDKSGSAEFNNLTIYDGAGNIVMSSGGGVSWDKVTGANRPANNATRNVYRGSWLSGSNYVIGDIVLLAGSTWACVADHTASAINEPPTLPITLNGYWGLHASAGAAGSPAEVYSLVVSSPILSKSDAGIYPSSVQCDAFRKLGSADTIGYAGRFKVYVSGTLTYTSASDESVKAITPDANATSVVFELYAAGGTSVLLDKVTVPIVSTNDGITVTMSNESHVMSADDTGAVDSYVGSGFTLRVFEGSTELTYAVASPFAGQYTLSAATVAPIGGISVGATSPENGRAVISQHSAMTVDAVSLAYTVTAKRKDGTSITFPIVQSLAKSRRGAIGADGADGSPGVSAVYAVLSNESHTLQADSTGVVSSFAGAETGVAVYIGTTNDTANWGVTPAASSGVTGSYNSTTKVYTVTAMSVDSGYVDFSFTKAGQPTLTKRFSVSKSKAGAAGSAASAELLTLSVDSQAFTFTDGAANPGSQTVNLIATLQNMTGTVVWTTSPAVTLTGTGNTRALSLANFGSNRQVTVTASLNGQSDSLTIIKLERSTAEAGATAGATIGTNVSGQITSANASTFIANGAIRDAQIGNVIQSQAYVAGTAGWKIDKAGNMELNAATFRGTIDVKSATSGARLEVKNNVIKVYDGNGTLRVKLGDLSA